MKQCTDIAAFAAVAADGFATDPAFVAACDNRQKLYSFFYDYFDKTPELYLMQSDAGEGYLCFYTSLEIPETEGDIDLSPYQILEQYYTSDYAVLDVLCVRPEFRGQGIADKLIGIFLQFCKEHHLRPLVEVFTDAHLSLYLRHGFFVAHTAQHNGISTYVLEKQL